MPSVTGIDDDGSGYGVKGASPTGSGVVGTGDQWAGVVASSVTGSGVSAFSDSGAGVLSVSNTGAGVSGQSGQASGVAGTSTDGTGVTGESVKGVGVAAMSQGDNGVLASSAAGTFSGVLGRNTAVQGGTGVTGIADGLGGIGVFGQSAARGVGVVGTGNAGILGQGKSEPGVRGLSEGDHGVVGLSTQERAAGVVGTGQAGPGVIGVGHHGPGVTGTSHVRGDAGVRGDNSDNGPGVLGVTTGVSGQLPDAAGVMGESTGSVPGVFGHSAGGNGVVGIGPGWPVLAVPNSGAGMVAISGAGVGLVAMSKNSFGAQCIGGVSVTGSLSLPAGAFAGTVIVAGDLKVSGNKQFSIDHPLDPSRRYLQHAAVESAELKTFYDGTVILDDSGTARVELPTWFAALNGDLRYALTAIGAPAPDLHIATEFDGTAFTIAGGRPGAKVCWQVTGVRQDPSARAHPLVVEEDKASPDIGRFLDPIAAGHTPAEGLTWLADLHARQAELDEHQP